MIQAKQKVHIETWGCQMNVADSERMSHLLKDVYEYTSEPQQADLIILNTCHIREKARHKVISRLGRLKEFKKTNPNLIITVAGCVAQAEGKQLLKSVPTIDILMGPGKIAALPDLIKQYKQENEQVLALGFGPIKKKETPKPAEPDVESYTSLGARNEVSRFVNIQQGCNNFCTFCVVPFTRGPEVSLTPDEIYAQALSFVQKGAQEITLLGQNVNSYGLDLVKQGKLDASDKGPFCELLEKVAKVPGLKSLRFTTSNPHDFTYPLAQLFRDEPLLGRYLHLPVQCGSDTILGTMKRKVTVASYLERVQWLRSFVPDMALSTDLIVGFPGETDEDFQGTLDLIERVRYAFVFAFKYSPRKRTAAIRFKEQVDESVKTARLARLNALQDRITLEENQKEIGQERSVLFMYPSKKEANTYYGRSLHFRLVKVKANENLVGQQRSVMIEDANKTALSGRLLL